MYVLSQAELESPTCNPMVRLFLMLTLLLGNGQSKMNGLTINLTLKELGGQVEWKENRLLGKGDSHKCIYSLRSAGCRNKRGQENVVVIHTRSTGIWCTYYYSKSSNMCTMLMRTWNK